MEFVVKVMCGGLKENGSQGPIGSKWHCWRNCVTGHGLEVSEAQARPSVSLFLLLSDPDVELSATLQHHVCRCATMFPHQDDDGLNLWDCKQAPVKCFPL